MGDFSVFQINKEAERRGDARLQGEVAEERVSLSPQIFFSRDNQVRDTILSLGESVFSARETVEKHPRPRALTTRLIRSSGTNNIAVGESSRGVVESASDRWKLE